MSRLAKILKGFPKHLRETGIELGRDRVDYLMLNLPPVCNYKCKKCFIATQERQVGNPLSAEEMIDLIDISSDLGAKAMGITGEGEPTMDMNLRTIVAYAASKGLIPFVATNASLLTREYAEFFREHDATLTISLDTLLADKYHEHCGVKNMFERVMANIETVKTAYKGTHKQVGDYNVVRLAIHSTVSSENLDEMRALKDLVNDDMLFSCDYVANIGDAKNNPVLRQVAEQVLIDVARSSTDSRIVIADRNGREVCGLFAYGFAVGSDGSIMLDAHAMETDGYVGNIRERPIVELVERSNELKQVFFEQFGTGYCLMRDENFGRFVDYLNR